MESTENDALLLTVPETAKRLRISRNMCYELVAEGRLPSVRLGRRVLVPRFALEEWIARQAGLPPSPHQMVSFRPQRH